MQHVTKTIDTVTVQYPLSSGSYKSNSKHPTKNQPHPPRTMTISPRIVGGILVVLSLMSLVFVAEATEVLLPADAASTVCERIFEYFTNCLQFLIGDSSYGRHMRRCCQHVDKLNILAKHRIGPGTVCWCIQVMVKGTTPALQSSKIRDLPHVCNTTLSFPISDSMDCSK